MSGAVTKAVTIGGQPYRMVFKFGTLRLAERELNESIATVFGSGGEKVGFDAVSAVFWAALQPGHAMTREAADDLIDQAGLPQVLAWVGEGVRDYFGADETAGADDKAAEGNAAATAATPAKGKKTQKS